MSNHKTVTVTYHVGGEPMAQTNPLVSLLLGDGTEVRNSRTCKHPDFGTMRKVFVTPWGKFTCSTKWLCYKCQVG